MTNTALLTLPNSDITIRYISAWAEQTVENLASKKLKFIPLANKRASKAILESMLTKHRPSLIFLNGHGSSDSVCGQDNKVLVKAGENEIALKDAVTYALSCSSAKILGPEAVIAGSITYIGYENDFIFFISPEKVTRPLEDKTADMFLTPANHVIVSLAKGHTTEEACTAARGYFLKNIQKLISSEVSVDEKEYIRFLIWDMRSLVSHGNAHAVVADK